MSDLPAGPAKFRQATEGDQIRLRRFASRHTRDGHSPATFEFIEGDGASSDIAGAQSPGMQRPRFEAIPRPADRPPCVPPELAERTG